MGGSYFHFNSYEKVLINDNYNVPTVVYHDGKNTHIGYEALNLSSDQLKINRNFKIDIGKYDSKNFSINYKIHTTADNSSVTAIKLFDLFMSKLINSCEESILQNGNNLPKSVTIAEPLSLQASEMDNSEVDEAEWLKFYRRNIRRYFELKGFENINFLPEPFAVFQYYKYCKKFEALNVNDKLVVMVIDFGGGTFDTCIIETTGRGEISQGQRNARPLGASSIAKGGSNYDREILDTLLVSHNITNDSEIRKATRAVRDVFKGKVKLSSLPPHHLNFYKNYINALVEIETIKIVLVNRIQNWSLDAQISESVTLSLPSNFFESNSNVVNYSLNANTLRAVFIKLYNAELKKGISLTLNRGLQSTQQNKIDYVLLSGGSAKIGWLRNLLIQDFGSFITNNKIVKLDNYKEVVSVGLAVECARRYYTESNEGDFDNTIYNTLNLVINPNNRGYNIPKYKCLNHSLPELLDGVLLPSATSMKNLINKNIRWKFKLKAEPKNGLDYFFLRNSVDPENLDNVHNLIKTHVNIETKKFSNHPEIELHIREDGTASAAFHLNNDKNGTINCEPFFIDMTVSDEHKSSASYLGIDFGTTNSSVSFISQDSIEKYSKQQQDEKFLINKYLIEDAPYLISLPYAKFINEYELEKKSRKFRIYYENSLSLLLYTLICELRYNSIPSKFLFDEYMRASGSLYTAICNILPQINKKCIFSNQIAPILNDNKNRSVLKEANAFLIDYKHGSTINAAFNYEPILSLLSNINFNLFNNNNFGFFNNIYNDSFTDLISGGFILAKGNGVFTVTENAKVNAKFKPLHPYLFSKDYDYGISLFPFMFWCTCNTHFDSDFGHLYVFDRIVPSTSALKYTAIDTDCNLLILPNETRYDFMYKGLTQDNGLISPSDVSEFSILDNYMP